MDEIEQEERALVVASLEVILKAVATLPAQEQALARVAIDKVLYAEGIL